MQQRSIFLGTLQAVTLGRGEKRRLDAKDVRFCVASPGRKATKMSKSSELNARGGHQ